MQTWPLLYLPLKKFTITNLIAAPSSPGRRPWSRARTAAEAGARHDADAAIDHVLQFVPQRRRRQGGVERDQPLQVQARQRLVRRLHSELFLPGLHRAVDL